MTPLPPVFFCKDLLLPFGELHSVVPKESLECKSLQDTLRAHQGEGLFTELVSVVKQSQRAPTKVTEKIHSEGLDLFCKCIFAPNATTLYWIIIHRADDTAKAEDNRQVHKNSKWLPWPYLCLFNQRATKKSDAADLDIREEIQAVSLKTLSRKSLPAARLKLLQWWDLPAHIMCCITIQLFRGFKLFFQVRLVYQHNYANL